MNIQIQSAIAYITDIDQSVNQKLERKFSYEILGAEFSTKYKEGKWDGIEHVYRNKRFPIGLLESITRELDFDDIQYQINDTRKLHPEIQDLNANSDILRDYQIDAVEKALEQRIPNFEGRMSSLQLSTGAGKSLVIGEILYQLQRKALVLVPSIEILYQLREMLSTYLNTKIGIIGDNQFEPEDIIVSTWQSLNSKSYTYQEIFDESDVLIIDESQHLGAPILREISHKIPAIYRFSCSGTAFREDNADLYIEATTGPVVYKIGYSQLIQDHYLVKPHVKILMFPSMRFSTHSTYNDVYNQYVTNNEFRNAYLIEEAKRLVEQGRKVLIFVNRIEHGEELVKLGGHDFVYSNHPDRRILIDSFKNGDLKCLISTSILNEGMDIPPIDALVLAAPQKSLIATIQKIGRSLRPFENKQDAIIIDTYDQCKYLSKASQRRINFYNSEKEFVMEPYVDTTKTKELDEYE